MQRNQIISIAAVVLVIVLLFAVSRIFVSVPAGHVAVATLFGDIQQKSYEAGLHFPINPLFEWHFYDARNKTLFQQAEVPSQDQLKTTMDVSIVYRIDGKKAPLILDNVGNAEAAVNVHLIPKLRSVLREQGKTIERAEDFFLEQTQNRLQTALETSMDEVAESGILVSAVLIRDITLPQSLQRQIELKKEREQEVEKQRAELERFKTEQQQRVEQAKAERAAAEEEAEKRRLIADAQAYEIEALNNAIANNPAYVQLQALEALKAISKDPSSKLYFMDGQSPNPLPLMNLGEPLTR